MGQKRENKNACFAQGRQEEEEEKKKKEEKESPRREEEKKEESENEGRKKKGKGRKKEKTGDERIGKKEKGRSKENRRPKKKKKTNARDVTESGGQNGYSPYEQVGPLQEPIEMIGENPTFSFLRKLRDYLFKLESGFEKLNVEKNRAFRFVKRIRKALKLRDKEKKVWAFSKRMEKKRNEIEMQTRRERDERSESLLQERLTSAASAAASAAATAAALAVSADGSQKLGGTLASDDVLMVESEKTAMKETEELGSPESDATDATTLYALPSPYATMPTMIPFDYEGNFPPQDEEGKAEKVQIWNVEGAKFTPSNSGSYSFYSAGSSTDSWAM